MKDTLFRIRERRRPELDRPPGDVYVIGLCGRAQTGTKRVVLQPGPNASYRRNDEKAFIPPGHALSA